MRGLAPLTYPVSAAIGGLVWELYDVRSGRHIDTVLPDTAWLLRLVS